jgi:hypothetical protein
VARTTAEAQINAPATGGKEYRSIRVELICLNQITRFWESKAHFQSISGPLLIYLEGLCSQVAKYCLSARTKRAAERSFLGLRHAENRGVELKPSIQSERGYFPKANLGHGGQHPLEELLGSGISLDRGNCYVGRRLYGKHTTFVEKQRQASLN